MSPLQPGPNVDASDMAPDMTVTAAVDRYLRNRVAAGEYRPSTAQVARGVLTRFARIVGPSRPVGKVRRHDIERWLASLELAPTSRRTSLCTVRTFIRWCHSHGLVDKDVTAGIVGPRQPRTVPRALPHEDVARLLAACPDRRARAIVLLMVQCGLRRGEVAALTREDVELDERLVVVAGKGGHRRIVALPDEAADAVAAYMAERPCGAGDPLVRSYQHARRGLSAQTVGDLVRVWLRTAGLKSGPWDGRSAHALRHTCASDVLDHCGDLRTVQEMLGHAQLSSTQIYLHRRDAAGRLAQAMAGRTYT